MNGYAVGDRWVHKCDHKCVCPRHPDLQLLYSPKYENHACQLVDCEFGHGFFEIELP